MTSLLHNWPNLSDHNVGCVELSGTRFCPQYLSRLFASFKAVSRFGLAVRRKRKDLGSIPLRLSFLFKKVVVCRGGEGGGAGRRRTSGK